MFLFVLLNKKQTTAAAERWYSNRIIVLII